MRGVRFAARDYEEEDTCMVCATVWCVFRGRTVGSENRGGVVTATCGCVPLCGGCFGARDYEDTCMSYMILGQPSCVCREARGLTPYSLTMLGP